MLNPFGNLWALGIAVLIAFGAGSVSGYWGYETFTLPGRLDERERIVVTREAWKCAASTQEAAQVAREAEEARQANAFEAARQAYRDAISARDAAAVAEQAQLEQEIADYEALIAESGRDCRLDDADLEFLLGHQPG